MQGLSPLTLLVFLPLPFLGLALGLPGRRERVFPWLSLGAAGLQGLLAFFLAFSAGHSGTFSFSERHDWFVLEGSQGEPLVSVQYYLAADGLSLAMLCLSGIVCVASAIASFAIRSRIKAYHCLFLLLSMAIYGTFLAQDAILFYLFFELLLIPMYFLVGLWGGARREFAAIQFFLYTLVGSLFILAGFAASYLIGGSFGTLSSDALPDMLDPVWSRPFLWGFSYAQTVFGLLFVGFAIKLPAVPLHTWLAPAHTEAPTPVSILLAGVLLKTGGYGLMRWALPIAPGAAMESQYIIAALGSISVVYGALMALAQQDLKRMVAFSSISHMGFVLLGLATFRPEGYSGAAYQMASHGVISAGLFLLAGVIDKKFATREIDNMEGLMGPMPRLACLMAVLFFAGMGLPGFSGFIGEFLALAASFASVGAGHFGAVWPMLALAGILVTSGFFLWTLRRMVMGAFYLKQPAMENPLSDVKGRDLYLLLALAALTILLGVWPGPWLDLLSHYAQADRFEW